MDPLPPETTTPMPPTLRMDYNRDLGWPGRPEDAPTNTPSIKIKPHITVRNWPRFIAKMSAPTDSVQP